jgi:hypothetical protein
VSTGVEGLQDMLGDALRDFLDPKLPRGAAAPDVTPSVSGVIGSAAHHPHAPFAGRSAFLLLAGTAHSPP